MISELMLLEGGGEKELGSVAEIEIEGKPETTKGSRRNVASDRGVTNQQTRNINK